MATANLSTCGHGETISECSADGVCVTSAMIGGAGGALVGTTIAGGSYEYAAVLIGTLGVVLGSVVAALAGRYLIYPVWKTLVARQHG